MEREDRSVTSWPARWVRDESFWRDVATRTLAILISGGLIYVGALLLGYVTAPGARPLIKAFLQIAWALAIFRGLIALMNTHYDRQRGRGEAMAGFRWFVAIPLTAITLVLLIGGPALIGLL